MGIAAKAVLLAAARLNAGLSPLTGPPSYRCGLRDAFSPWAADTKVVVWGSSSPLSGSPCAKQPQGGCSLPAFSHHHSLTPICTTFPLALLTRLCLENCILSSASILMIFPAASSSSSLTVDWLLLLTGVSGVSPPCHDLLKVPPDSARMCGGKIGAFF